MKFLILNFLRALVVFIKALLNATYEINPIDYSHKTVAHYNTYHTSITEWSILKPLITVLRTWYILPVHYISVQYSHSNSTPYMGTPNCPVMMPMKVRFLGAKPDPGFLYGAASQFPPRQKSYFLCITIWICCAVPLIIRRQSFGFRLFHKSYFHSSSGIVFPVRGQFGICVAATFESLWVTMIWSDLGGLARSVSQCITVYHSLSKCVKLCYNFLQFATICCSVTRWYFLLQFRCSESEWQWFEMIWVDWLVGELCLGPGKFWAPQSFTSIFSIGVVDKMSLNNILIRARNASKHVFNQSRNISIEHLSGPFVCNFYP